MSWFRTDDRADDHPKLIALSHAAFRLWWQGGLYCARHQTDGFISLAVVRGFRYYTPARAQEVIAGGLWESTGSGVQMHDYLHWNESKSDLSARREAARERTRKWRQTASGDGVGDASRDANSVYGVVRKEKIQVQEGESEGKPSRPVSSGHQRGRLFLHRWQLDALIDILGAHADGFGLDEWLDDINRRLAGSALPRDPWRYVKAELHTELARRGLASPEAPQMGKQTTRLAAALASINAAEGAAS